MESIVVELVGEPRGKGRPKFTKQGFAYTPATTRKHEAALRYAAGEAMNGAPPLQGPLTVSIVATFPIPVSWSKRKQREAEAGLVSHVSKPDCDNLLKCLDAFHQVVWVDDKQIVSATIQKVYGVRPATRIEVREVVLGGTST